MKKTLFVKISGKPILDFVNTRVQHADSVEEKIDSSKSAEAFFGDVFKNKLKFNRQDHECLLARRQDLRKLFRAISRPKSQLDLISTWPLNQTMLFNLKLGQQSRSKVNPIKIEYQLLKQSASDVILFNNTIDFLKDCDPHRLKKCKSATCSHLFYDESKSNTRIWCSMKSCGNLAKVRKFRAFSKS